MHNIHLKRQSEKACRSSSGVARRSPQKAGMRFYSVVDSHYHHDLHYCHLHKKPLTITDWAATCGSKWMLPCCEEEGGAGGRLQPRHCALSLVGEPIMYPEINSLIDDLHARRISTFLVTNAQFPDCIQCAPLLFPPPPPPASSFDLTGSLLYP
jgi:hypothetical protein